MISGADCPGVVEVLILLTTITMQLSRNNNIELTNYLLQPPAASTLEMEITGKDRIINM